LGSVARTHDDAFGLLRFCFDSLGLNKVFLRTIVGNNRSSKLAERFGFLKAPR